MRLEAGKGVWIYFWGRENSKKTKTFLTFPTKLLVISKNNDKKVFVWLTV